MTVSIPDTEPTEARAGDTWKWTRAGGDYPASTYTLVYTFTQAATRKQVTATSSGDDYSITHRLSQIRWADLIIVLRKGKISAIGTHDELMQTSPAYQAIFGEV